MTDEVFRRLTTLARRVGKLEAREPSPPWATVSTDNVSNPPTDAELDTAFGNAADVRAGFLGVVDDNGAGATAWLCVAVGSAWWYEQLTKAV